MDNKSKFFASFLDDYGDVLDKFEKLIEEDSSLPKNIPRLLLYRYLQVYDFDIEKSKILLEKNIEFRKKHSYLFTNRDLQSNEMQHVLNIFQYSPFPIPSKENYQIFGSRFMDFDANQFHPIDIFKFMIMVQDMQRLQATNTNGEIFIHNAKGFSFWHGMKLVAPGGGLSTFLKYGQEVIPGVTRQNHIVNCSSIIPKIFNLIKPFLKREIIETLHFHSSGYESLHQFIPKESLPAEYGGTAGCFDEYFSETISNLKEMNDYLVDDENFF